MNIDSKNPKNRQDKVLSRPVSVLIEGMALALVTDRNKQLSFVKPFWEMYGGGV